MEVIITEIIAYLFRIPGSLFLTAITKKSFDHWMERDRAFGVGVVGAVVLGLFIYIAVLASG